MTSNKCYIFSFLVAIYLNYAYAGAVSGGGGDVVVRQNIKISDIGQVIASDAGAVTLFWLNAKKSSFLNLSQTEQNESIFFKLFVSNKDIFEVVRQLQIEVRTDEPCYDQDGQPHDGSIYARRVGVICISGLNLTSKLNNHNFREETIALIIHELSHHFGTTEEEADKIQLLAANELSQVAIERAVAKSWMDQYFFDRTKIIINQLISNPEKWLSYKKIEEVLSLQSRFLGDFSVFGQRYNDFIFNYVSSELWSLFNVGPIGLVNIRDYLCITDQSAEVSIRRHCQENLERIFQSDLQITAKQYFERNSRGIPRRLNHSYEQVTLKRVSSQDDIMSELEKYLTYLETISDNIGKNNLFNFSVYETKSENERRVTPLSLAIEEFNKRLVSERPLGAFFLDQELVKKSIKERLNGLQSNPFSLLPLKYFKLVLEEKFPSWYRFVYTHEIRDGVAHFQIKLVIDNDVLIIGEDQY